MKRLAENKVGKSIVATILLKVNFLGNNHNSDEIHILYNYLD